MPCFISIKNYRGAGDSSKKFTFSAENSRQMQRNADRSKSIYFLSLSFSKSVFIDLKIPSEKKI